jgi:hypothetical protein
VRTSGSSGARYLSLSGRAGLLAACALCCLLSAHPAAWALSTEGAAVTIVPDSLLASESLAVSGSEEGLASASPARKETPVSGSVQLSLGRVNLVRLSGFTYAGKLSSQALGLTPFSGGPTALAPSFLGRSLGMHPEAVASDDRATAVKMEYGRGGAKLAVDLSDVGARFPEAGVALQSSDQAVAEALKAQAGLRTMNLSGTLPLGSRLNLTSTSVSVYNDKPGDEKRGLTTTDWTNALAFSTGRNSNLKLNLVDHSESWDPSTGKTGLDRRTSQLSWDTSFGAGGANSLRLGLTDAQTKQGDQEQSERTQEMHLALAPLSRLKLSADQVAKEDAQGAAQTTSNLGAVLQFAAGSELTANLTTASPDGSADTRSRYLKLTSGLGGGGSAMKLCAEQKLSRVDGSGTAEEAKYELTGGLGRGAGQVHLRGLVQEKRAVGADGALEQTSLLHLDRAFGPRVKLSADQEQVVKGTNEQPEPAAKTTVSLAADLDARTKLVAAAGSQRSGASPAQSIRDVMVERRVAPLVLRAEERQRADVAQTSSRSYGADLPIGKLPDWAADFGRRHEFGDIYEFLVAKEAGWLELPFAGLRFARTQRGNGPDAGVDTTLISYRGVLARRYHVQVTYQDRPEYEEGDNKGRPMEVERRYVALGAPLTRGLAVRGWLTMEDKPDDPLSTRHAVGLGLFGKVHGDGQLEVSYAQGRGQWEGQGVTQDAIAVLYAHKVSEENQIAIKVGYGQGEGLADGRPADCRVSIQYHKPV